MKILILIGCLFFVACQSSPTEGSDKCYKVVDPIAFDEKMSSTSDFILVDVRSAEEFNEGHIEGSLNWDVSNGDFEKKISEFDTSKQLYVYCRSGNRSTTARNIAIESGFCDVVELGGGFVSWSKVHEAH
ncbi:MAG: rhodanese-like domain-containing protein [Chitinophagales bacterium]|nr:rhodanese-like domain-containing protein [Chitinophagales bacterium]